MGLLWLREMLTLQVIPSRVDGEVKVSGLLGRAAPIDKKGPAVGDQVVGMGGTTQWKLASLVLLPASVYPCIPHVDPHNVPACFRGGMIPQCRKEIGIF